MLGNFQRSNLRIELDADSQAIANSLQKAESLRKWMWPQTLSANLPEKINTGTIFTSNLGFIEIGHEVQKADDNSLLLLLSQGIDGYHQWHWGDGWIQSNLEGVSLLPLNLGHTASLFRLRQYLASN